MADGYPILFFKQNIILYPMFLRIKKIQNKNGKTYEYEQLVESYRANGKTHQKVIMTLGKKGEVSNQKIHTIISTLAKKDPAFELVRKFDQKTPSLKILFSKEYGSYFVFRFIWEKLYLQKSFENIAPHGHKKEFAEMVFLLVLYRILSPGSERKMSKIFEPKIHHELSYKPKLNQWYQVIHRLQKNRNVIEKTVFEQVQGFFPEKMSLFYFDTTSLVLFGEYKNSELAAYGQSKDKRSDKKQIIVGLVLTENSLPVGVTEEIGNKPDVKNFVSMLEKMKQKYQAEEIIFVGDKGMNSKTNREKLSEEKQKYILGVRAQNEKLIAEAVSEINFENADLLPMSEHQKKLIRKIRKGENAENFQTKVAEKSINGRRIIFFFNPIEKHESEITRATIIAKLKRKIQTVQDLKKLIGNSGYRSLLTITNIKEGKEKVEVKINESKIELLKRFDGITAVETNTNLSAVEVARQYKQLITVEHSFSDLKTTMECRPVFHKTDHNIKSHIFINFLALLLYSTLFHLLGSEFEEKARYEIISALREIQIHLVEENKRKYLIRTELTPVFQNICSLLKLKPPKRILGQLKV